MINEYFFQRKTFRNFKQEDISKKEIENILSAASFAPTCGNMQLYSVIITRNNDKKRKLEKLHYNQPAATTAPVILTVCADFKRFKEWCKLNKANPRYNNFHSFIMAMTDAIIYAQQIVTIAELNGYGTCYLGTVNYNAKEISELLKLPDLVIPVASIAIGVVQNDEVKTERMKVNAFAFDEEYPELNEEIIKENFQIKEEFPLNKKFVEDNKKANLAQVFTDIRYPGHVNEKVSKSFMDLLKEKGFV